jgi:hypothetical protein
MYRRVFSFFEKRKAYATENVCGRKCEKRVRVTKANKNKVKLHRVYRQEGRKLMLIHIENGYNFRMQKNVDGFHRHRIRVW